MAVRLKPLGNQDPMFFLREVDITDPWRFPATPGVDEPLVHRAGRVPLERKRDRLLDLLLRRRSGREKVKRGRLGSLLISHGVHARGRPDLLGRRSDT